MSASCPVSIPQLAGTNISKDWHDVHLHLSGNYQRYANDAVGHKALFKWLGGWTIERIAYKATGAYRRTLEQAGRALPFIKLNPRRARKSKHHRHHAKAPRHAKCIAQR
jgi:transposase